MIPFVASTLLLVQMSAFATGTNYCREHKPGKYHTHIRKVELLLALEERRKIIGGKEGALAA